MIDASIKFNQEIGAKKEITIFQINNGYIVTLKHDMEALCKQYEQSQNVEKKIADDIAIERTMRDLLENKEEWYESNTDEQIKKIAEAIKQRNDESDLPDPIETFIFANLSEMFMFLANYLGFNINSVEFSAI